MEDIHQRRVTEAEFFLDDTQHQRLHAGVYTKVYTDAENSAI
jgi:hypothetical protein